MKKLLALVLSLALVFALAACGSSGKEDAKTSNDFNNKAEEVVETDDVVSDTEIASEQEPAEDKDDSVVGGIDSEFKASMDSYEKFMNEYVDFMKKYQANPTDMSLLTDYAKYMSDYAEFVEDFGNWENQDLNTQELAYYIEVQSRVNKKLLDVAQ